uniref:Uncharacterized protein n=1 Tax=Fundulus heteroclitus TaxID=8078 RepID=A0A3Q2P7R0_FUNHE
CVPLEKLGSDGSVGGAAPGFNTAAGLTSSFSGVAGGSSAAQDGDIAQMVANLLRLSPNDRRPVMQFHWSSPQVPLDMVEKRPVYPSSLIIHSNNGYQRARDFRSDSKYTKETFDNIPQPGTPQNPESGSKGHHMSQ